MRSKAYVKKGNLPMAPSPTRPVRSEGVDSEIARDMNLHCFSPEVITDEQRERAVRSRIEHLANAWTYEEIEQLKRLYKSGISRKEITGSFPNRTREAVDSKLRKMIKKGEL